MKEKIIATVLEKMHEHLQPDQATMLQWVMSVVLDDYAVERRSTEVTVYDGSAEEYAKRFLVVKHLAGCSDRTIELYRFNLQKFILNLRRPLLETDTNDIRCYLAAYKERRKVGNTTLNNMRASLSSFFTWLHEEGLIAKNPMRRIPPIKTPKVIRQPFSPEDMEHLRMECQQERNLAIMEFLYSTGVRVSEAVQLNRDQINFAEGECIVYGKGAKEREVFINPRTCIHLKKYLDSRTDDNPALFVWTKKPHRRLSEKGIWALLHNLGLRANVEKTHPHRFRRTLATDALNRGMPLQEVKQMLGHEKADTTLIYCTVTKASVKMSHRKYIA